MDKKQTGGLLLMAGFALGAIDLILLLIFLFMDDDYPEALTKAILLVFMLSGIGMVAGKVMISADENDDD